MDISYTYHVHTIVTELQLRLTRNIYPFLKINILKEKQIYISALEPKGRVTWRTHAILAQRHVRANKTRRKDILNSSRFSQLIFFFAFRGI